MSLVEPTLLWIGVGKMKKFKQFLKEDASVNERCWDGYKPVSKLIETPEPAAVTTAQQLFVAFLHNTGAKDHVSKLAAKTDKVFLGTGTDSKYDYTIDIDKQTVTAVSKTSTKRSTYVWDKITNKVKMLESTLQEAVSTDAEIEDWINDNKQR